MWKRKLLFWGSMGLLTADVTRRPITKIVENWRTDGFMHHMYGVLDFVSGGIYKNSTFEPSYEGWENVSSVLGIIIALCLVILAAFIFVFVLCGALWLIGASINHTVVPFYNWAHPKTKSQDYAAFDDVDVSRDKYR